jgi:outer membrane protein assembly factor BamB
VRFALTILAATCAAASASAADLSATAYQVTPAHNALIKFAGTWGPQLKTAWTATLDGTPGSSLFAEKSVYALVSGSPDELVRINAATGQVIWKYSTGSNSSEGIAYDKGELFSVNSSGTLTAFAAGSGKMLWTVALPGQYAFSSAPSALDGIVYVGGAGDGGTLYAVDEASGKLIWTQSVANGDDSSPAVTPTGVYVSYPCQYYDFAPSTGKLIWHYNGGCDGGGGDTVVVYNNLAYIRDYTGSDSILNATTGAVVGSFAASQPPAIRGNIGYFLDNSTVAAIEPKTSKLLWEFTGDGSISSPPLLVNDDVVLTSSQGHLYVVDGAKGTVSWSTTLGQAPSGQIGAGNNMIFVPLGSTLVAYASAN